MARGIRDQVAIVGMGCSRFGERWDCGPDDLMIEAFQEASADAGIERDRIEAAWLGVFYQEQSTSKSGLPLSMALRLPNVPVTRVENLCATGTEALRGAVYAVASGAVDIALAMGVEKLKDTGFGGLPERAKGTFEDLWQPGFTPPGAFAQLGAAYAAKHGLSMQDVKRAMAHVSWKSHENAALNPKAHLRNRITIEQALGAPMIAYPLGTFDCCGVSDGAACAIAADIEGRHETRLAAARAYAEAGIAGAEAIDLFEVHDCFSITELVLMEDLGFSAEGRAVYDILDGRYDRSGAKPCQIDGGLKCFGHPVGASGLRMAYEMYLQLLGRAGARQHSPQGKAPALGLTHNLGGIPNRNVAAIGIFGLMDV